MRVLFLVLFSISSALAQSTRRAVPESSGANLPSQPVGPNDLIDVSVYDAPELSRTIRIGSDGFLALPILQQTIMANGLYPKDLEAAIRAALRQEDILVNPMVTVTI